MKGSTFSTIALLAGLMLASSCNLENSTRWQKREHLSNRKFSVPVLKSSTPREKYAPYTLIISNDHDSKKGTVVLNSTVKVLVDTDIPDIKDINEAINYLSSIKSVIQVNRNHIYHIFLQSYNNLYL